MNDKVCIRLTRAESKSHLLTKSFSNFLKDNIVVFHELYKLVVGFLYQHIDE